MSFQHLARLSNLRNPICAVLGAQTASSKLYFQVHFYDPSRILKRPHDYKIIITIPQEAIHRALNKIVDPHVHLTADPTVTFKSSCEMQRCSFSGAIMLWYVETAVRMLAHIYGNSHNKSGIQRTTGARYRGSRMPFQVLGVAKKRWGKRSILQCMRGHSF